ncbi:hypothetical protein [Dickeya dadantii]|uniref:hypothetical protein n=1 Tax=Dickeya dadantii TaxID=204038 RepID=UPI0021DA26DE|nr:hypothetical protein [Dickeya dadantii]
MNIEIYHFASGEARQLHDEGFAAFLYLPAQEHQKRKDYGVDIDAQVVQWIRDGQLDQLLGDDVAQVARLKQEAFG